MNNYLLLSMLICLQLVETKAQTFKAILSGNHEPFPVLSLASGEVTAILEGDTLSLGGSFAGISSGVDTSIAGGAHVHTGIAGTNGGVAFALKTTLSEGLNDGTFDAASNTYILDEDQKLALSERRLYINVHSTSNPGGEIRGQLVPSADEYYSANLFGSNESISVMTDGRGAVILELTGNTVTISGSFSNLSTPLATSIGGGIHIHQATTGSNGGILQGLNVILSEDSLGATIPAELNTFTVTDEELASLRAHRWYVNVHSARFASGELRGQLTPISTAKFRVNLSGANELPPVTSFARGKLEASLIGNTLIVSGSFSGLESDINLNVAGGAHIHAGMAGRNGGIQFPLAMDVGDDNRSATFDPTMNTFTISGDTLSALLGRALYVNVHSLNHPGGELRGQIAPESQYFMSAFLSAAQQTASFASPADGAVLLEVLGEKVTASGSFRNLRAPLAVNVAGGAHIHFAPAGTNGPIRYALVTTPDADPNSGRFRAADNSFDITTTRRDSVRGRLAYVNVHSDVLPGGEIRGQLLHEAVAYFYTPLSGAGEVNAINTGGLGAAVLEYTGAAAVVTGSFRNLSSTLATQTRGGAHIHFGIAGKNGPILRELGVSTPDSLNGVFRPGDNTAAISAGLMDTVRQRMTYVNIHSANFGGGELRGNFRPLSHNLLMANLRGKNATIPNPSTGRGTVLIETLGNTITATGAFDNLVGDFNAAIAGGAHIHLGAAGTNGGIIVPLKTLIEDGLKSGVFLADSNRVSVPDSVRMPITGNGAYVNIHSTTIPSGEIRGQILPEVNLTPSATSFTSPVSGDTIIIEGDLTMPFRAEWLPSTDPNNHALVYVWQLSTTADFSNTAIALNTGSNTFFETSFGAVDTLLGLLGVDSGDAVTVYHRIVASDGSLCSTASIDSVVLVRGVSTSIKENPYFDQLFTLFPSPTQNEIQLQVEMKQAAQGSIRIMDMTGRIIQQQQTILLQGANIIMRNVSGLSPGSYIAQLVVNDQVSAARSFIKK